MYKSYGDFYCDNYCFFFIERPERDIFKILSVPERTPLDFTLNYECVNSKLFSGFNQYT